MKKILLAIGVICSILLLVLGGCSMQGKSKKDSEKEELVKIVKSKEAKKLFDDWILGVDPKAFTDEGKIKSYKVDYDSVETNPMDGIMVDLAINDNKNIVLHVTLIFNGSTEKLEQATNSWSRGLVELMKG
ncbi:DUF1310 family protein [Streptococcus oricebi]|uniref:DUF1310 family protein n=1 Tax=Streptococcus oricebi TaxID=1547447 RepID=A0ABS5B0S9_9STRE|nr:DUF1310 family protein [Streptococcus oricebi]MBP2622433.1 hypothetical protein [Streptococcus oricebi]